MRIMPDYMKTTSVVKLISNFVCEKVIFATQKNTFSQLIVRFLPRSGPGQKSKIYLIKHIMRLFSPNLCSFFLKIL